MMPLIHFGPFLLPAYGFMMSNAVLAGVQVAVNWAKKYGPDPPLVYYAGSLVSRVTDFLHIVCGMCGQSTGSEPSNAVENGIGTLGPHKGFGLLVVHLDELQDGRF